MKNVTLVAAAVLLPGCALLAGGGWYKEGGTEQQFIADRSSCEMQAMQAAPPIYTQPPPQAQQAPAYVCTQNYGVTRCEPQQRQTFDASMYFQRQDQNEIARLNYARSCLQARGYRWVTK